MPHCAAFHSGLHCVPRYLHTGVQNGKGNLLVDVYCLGTNTMLFFLASFIDPFNSHISKQLAPMMQTSAKVAPMRTNHCISQNLSRHNPCIKHDKYFEHTACSHRTVRLSFFLHTAEYWFRMLKRRPNKQYYRKTISWIM